LEQLGFFLCCFCCIPRTFPVIAQAEVKNNFERTGDNDTKRREQIKIHTMSNKVIYAIYNDDDILMDAVKKPEQLIIILKKFYPFPFTVWIKLWELHQQD
jgi:hypothetical protein